MASITLNPKHSAPASPQASVSTGVLHTRATPFPAAVAAEVPVPAAWEHQPSAPPLQLTARPVTRHADLNDLTAKAGQPARTSPPLVRCNLRFC